MFNKTPIIIPFFSYIPDSSIMLWNGIFLYTEKFAKVGYDLSFLQRRNCKYMYSVKSMKEHA